jgi:hypothetical protein
MRDKKCDTLLNDGTPNLKPHQLYPKVHILNLNKTNNLVEDNKHNHQAKLPVLTFKVMTFKCQ